MPPIPYMPSWRVEERLHVFVHSKWSKNFFLLLRPTQLQCVLTHISQYQFFFHRLFCVILYLFFDSGCIHQPVMACQFCPFLLKVSLILSCMLWLFLLKTNKNICLYYCILIYLSSVAFYTLNMPSFLHDFYFFFSSIFSPAVSSRWYCQTLKNVTFLFLSCCFLLCPLRYLSLLLLTKQILRLW
jgi:hypothetical protein